jgi:hypothetical protein
MGAIILAFGLVAGLVSLAANQADDPTIKRFLQRRRLDLIARKPDKLITLLEAEDGLVLSRRLGDGKLLARFEKLVRSGKLPRRTT